jgi:hypothetical protein
MDITKNEKMDDVENVQSTDKITLDLDVAADFVRNYLMKMDGLSQRHKFNNTKFLWIEVNKLIEMINAWNKAPLLQIVPGAQQNIDAIRMYPMIYKKDYQDSKGKDDRKSMLNLCMVPLLKNVEMIESGIKFFGDIQNEIGQCPPPPTGSSICNDDGAILLNAALDLTGPPSSD